MRTRGGSRAATGRGAIIGATGVSDDPVGASSSAAMEEAVIVLRLRPELDLTGPPHRYRIAGHDLLADDPMDDLEAFAVYDRAAPPLRWHLPAAPLVAPAAAHVVWRGCGWIGGTDRDLACSRTSDGYRLLVDDDSYWISADGRHVARSRGATALDADGDAGTVLGPVLMLALALRGTFALHAGAVDVGGQSALFVGESGAGKSTLSRALGGGALPGARRIADDIVPFEAGPGGAEILPHFPQLKLPRDAQPGRLAPERMSAAAIYVLPTGPRREDDPGGSTESRSVDVRTEPLAGQAAVLALVRHSVASVLFDPPTAARHLAVCAQVAGQTPIRRLAHPWGLDVLPRVCDAILADLATLRRSPAAPA